MVRKECFGPITVKSLESLLGEKGLVDRAALDALVDTFEHKIGPRNGARVVAKGWMDSAYKQRLLADATAAIAELGYTGQQGEHMVVLENTPGVHNMVVCTLCSCYPWPTLGLPPVWYTSAATNRVGPRGRTRKRRRAVRGVPAACGDWSGGRAASEAGKAHPLREPAAMGAGGMSEVRAYALQAQRRRRSTASSRRNAA
jgi:hypothetical protein